MQHKLHNSILNKIYIHGNVARLGLVFMHVVSLGRSGNSELEHDSYLYNPL